MQSTSDAKVVLLYDLSVPEVRVVQRANFSGGPVVGTPHTSIAGIVRGTGLIPGQGTKISRAMWHGQKQIHFFFNFNKTLF